MGPTLKIEAALAKAKRMRTNATAVRVLVANKRWSQKELCAKLSDLGIEVTASKISKVLNGVHKPSDVLRCGLAELLGHPFEAWDCDE